MDATSTDTQTLQEFLETVSEEELADLIYKWGEERFSRRIARAIMTQLNTKGIQTTSELAAVIQRAVPRQHSRVHPATRTFQAFRIIVNREFEHLEIFLNKFPQFLSKGGRLGIVTFHSLEDRVVKMKFKELAASGNFRLINKKVECAEREEVLSNPSARSAKLRVIEKN